jgi:DNA-binding IclR family transcriptional regulator
MNAKPNRPNAIEKALDILTSFIPHNTEMGTSEVSKRLGLHKATASRILLILARKGFLSQDPETKKFRLGRVSLDLGRAVMNSLESDLVQIAKPYLDKLREQLNETITLEYLIGESTIMLYVAEGQHRHRMAGNIGDRLPVNATAGAKAILAFSDTKIIDDLLTDGVKFPPLTPNSLTDPVKIRRQLQQIRRQGYSFDNEEADIGINGIGFPIFDHDNSPVAAFSIVGPSHRINLTSGKNLISLGKKTAQSISALLLSP